MAVLLTAAACKKIDSGPITSYSSDNYWQTPAQASAALNGAYKALQSTLNTEFIYYGEARSDNLVLALQNNNASISVINNTLNVNSNFTDWGGFYQVIKQANLIISNVQLMKANGLYTSTTEYNRVLGQAYGLRALCYFWLVRIWGNVPLITQPITGDIISFQTPRTDTVKVYNQISTDLILAGNLLPSSYTDVMQNRAMLTKGAIDAIQTDYYMHRNNMDSALITSARFVNSSGAIVNSNYRLTTLYDPSINYFASPALIDNSEYAQMFQTGYSAESIFEIAFSYNEGATSGIYGIYGSAGNAQFNASNNILAKFDPNDIRTVADLKSLNQVFKFFPKGTFNTVTGNDKNVILYRLADILLLRAEALNAKGQVANAFTLVNQVRARAGVPAIAASQYNAFSRVQAEDFILDERARELCFEGKRWFDLVRTGRAIPIMKPINGLSDPANILWPISLNVINQNPLIEQNSYYK
ncbi:RagB/SusD family nutrient uptake outer membrane protein [Mucilaginibacter sp. RS28]|uniref:RagB/SusD family nutrient uptake outer membrane protein n=1 Tax=Mucilaginibacter straminoryzae TaxID=2932774 RepID=A0A9X1X0P7_9SPHI|nr:RagB/SusD family nutrient uptake outer membrane protein [Mucilaginibacter straminoryzae]MCJ8209004.1 RagB/SusD family nutrient uptake outer membrane protein [Mucilaginibacter straminoryzae]